LISHLELFSFAKLPTSFAELQQAHLKALFWQRFWNWQALRIFEDLFAFSPNWW